MPWRHSRSGTGLGPGEPSGHGGSNGSISAHKSSSTIHSRVVTHHERSNHHIGHARPGHFGKILLRPLRASFGLRPKRVATARTASLKTRRGHAPAAAASMLLWATLSPNGL